MVVPSEEKEGDRCGGKGLVGDPNFLLLIMGYIVSVRLLVCFVIQPTRP